MDYEDDLIQQDWSLRDVATGETALEIPYMAFWNEPFDIFHTALAVVHHNGAPVPDSCNMPVWPARVAIRTASNVLFWAGDTVELWLLDERMGVTSVPHVPVQQASGLIAEFRDKLCPAEVAKGKIRWRQYALYEADPNGNAFQQWSIKPNIDQTSRMLKKLVRDVVPATAENLNAPADRIGLLQDRTRWLFRLLALRVGRDREWGIASHLHRSDPFEFAAQARRYPVPWQSDTRQLTDGERTRMSESVLSRLEHYDFSTTDPIFITKAVGANTLHGVRLKTDLFPTPRPFAWDMMASIPLREEMYICDATAGTGTFLIAAGHAVWDQANIRVGGLPDLREILIGGDRSPLSADLARIGLDLAFGWQDAGWNVGMGDATDTLERIPSGGHCALVGNLPWSAIGRGRNASAVILEQYVQALSRRDSGCIAVIAPRSMWTSVNQEDVRLRSRMAEVLQVESAWELPWGAIRGGRAQAMAAVLSRGQPATTSIWKQVDQSGAVHTVGYSLSGRDHDDDYLPAPAQYLRGRLAGLSTLGNRFDVWEGVNLRGGQSVKPPLDGTVPLLRRKREVDVPVADLPALTVSDIVDDGGWIHENSHRRARSYAAGLLRLPQVAIPRAVYEGTSTGMQSLLIKRPMFLSDAFLIAVPKRDFSVDFVRGVATLINAAVGRLWLHLFATFGRHLSSHQVTDFPLPSPTLVEMWGRIASKRASQRTADHAYREVFRPCFTLDEELEMCRAYGFEDRECAAILGLSSLVGITSRIPRRWLDGLDGTLPDLQRIDQLLKKVEEVDPDSADFAELHLHLLSEQRKQDRLVVGDSGCELSIKKTSVAEEE